MTLLLMVAGAVLGIALGGGVLGAVALGALGCAVGSRLDESRGVCKRT